MIRYPKRLILEDLSILGEHILYLHLKKEVPFEDILKPLRGKKYMLYKQLILKIKKHLNDPEYILLDDRYFQIKHINTRRLYKLYLFLDKPSVLPLLSLNLVKIPIYQYPSYNKRRLNPVFDELFNIYGISFSFNNNNITSLCDISDFFDHINNVYSERFKVMPSISDRDKKDINKLLNTYSLEQLKKYYTYYIFNKNSLKFSNFGIQKFIKNIETISAAAEVADEYHFVWSNDLKSICEEVYTVNNPENGRRTAFGLDGSKIYFVNKPYIDDNNHLIVSFGKVDKDGVISLYNAEGDVFFLKNLFHEYREIKKKTPFLKIVS